MQSDMRARFVGQAMLSLLLGASAGRGAADEAPAWVLPDVAAPGVERCTFESKAATTKVSYFVYKPPEYDADPQRRFPVLYWLHGSGGGTAGVRKLAEDFDGAIRAGKIPPMLIVMPNGLPESLWLDSTDGRIPMETIVIRELLPQVDASFRTMARREGRIVEGFSMGGYGAARFGFTYPELFANVSILSGGPLQREFTVSPRVGRRGREQVLQSVFGGDLAAFTAQSPWEIAGRNASNIAAQCRIRMAIGDRDEMLEIVRSFHRRLTDLKIPHAYLEVPGADHNPPRVFDGMGDERWAFYRSAFGALSPAAAGPSAAPRAGPVGPVVRIASGSVSGAESRGVLSFVGIPFAAPPVGDLRWRPPQPVTPWAGIRACTNFGPACPQPADMVYNIPFKPQSEDCLYANVWTPATNGTPRPVMVWIHGGGNTIGGANSPVYDGRHFAASGVVLVSIQYRLGPFGYLAHPALTAEAKALDGRAASGNYGLMDQLAALKWVQANVAAFGGDPRNVTIFGESAGAANVTHLMTSPLATGLFHRAIAESGYFGETTPMLASDRSPAIRSAHATGLEYGKAIGVPGDDAAALKALRALSAEKLLSVPFAVGSLRSAGGAAGGKRPFRLGPVVDGWVLPEEPGAVWAAGRMLKVPLMAGSLLDDGSIFSRGSPVKHLLGYRLAVRAIFGDDADRAREVFPAAGDDQVHGAVHRILTIMSFRAPARRLVRWMEAAGGDAWLYHFTRKPESGRSDREGVFHGLELGYAFKTLVVLGNATDRAVADDMHRRWINFAAHGDPNRPFGSCPVPEPAWPKYDRASDRHLEFGDRIVAGAGLDREACDLADRAAIRRRASPLDEP